MQGKKNEGKQKYCQKQSNRSLAKCQRVSADTSVSHSQDHADVLKQWMKKININSS